MFFFELRFRFLWGQISFLFSHARASALPFLRITGCLWLWKMCYSPYSFLSSILFEQKISKLKKNHHPTNISFQKALIFVHKVHSGRVPSAATLPDPLCCSQIRNINVMMSDVGVLFVLLNYVIEHRLLKEKKIKENPILDSDGIRQKSQMEPINMIMGRDFSCFCSQ